MSLFNIFRKTYKFLYTEDELDEYEKFIEENFGRYDGVIHEIVSPDIHLDIIVVPPTDKHNFYKLITMGMGAYNMKIPKELKSYKLNRAELIIYLPPTWDINSSVNENYWPIEYLKILARMPIYQNTWLGYGHTISASADNKSFADNTKLCSIILSNGMSVDKKLLNLNMKNGYKINLYPYILKNYYINKKIMQMSFSTCSVRIFLQY